MEPTLGHYLVVSVLLLAAGVVTMLLKRNALGVLMGMELMVAAAGLNLVAFNAFAPAPPVLPPYALRPPTPDGQVFALFIIVLSAAEAALGVAIILNYYRTRGSMDVERARGGDVR